MFFYNRHSDPPELGEVILDNISELPQSHDVDVDDVKVVHGATPGRLLADDGGEVASFGGKSEGVAQDVHTGDQVCPLN